AAALVCEAALRTGAGLVTLAARPEVAAAIHGVPEAMFAALPGAGPLGAGDLPALREALKGKSALAIGPGIPRGPETGPLIGELLASAEAAVIDADALNALAEHRERIAEWVRRAPTLPVLTPHPGEFARLAGEGGAAIRGLHRAERRAHGSCGPRRNHRGLRCRQSRHGDRRRGRRAHRHRRGRPGAARRRGRHGRSGAAGGVPPRFRRRSGR